VQRIVCEMMLVLLRSLLLDPHFPIPNICNEGEWQNSNEVNGEGKKQRTSASRTSFLSSSFAFLSSSSSSSYLLFSLSLHSRSPFSLLSNSSRSLSIRSSLSSILCRFCNSYERILFSVAAKSEPIE